ncbi:MAG: DUF748 domain-containing protein [Candidatus Hinthialibacter antarcticus]|nr:DUF748 domain-containing protein [Candidatus Hinthialibacter antarcticus]
MKKILLVGFVVLLAVGLIGGTVAYFYWESIAVSYIKSTLENDYQIIVEFDDLDINPATRSVTLENASFFDLNNRDSGALLKAEEISVWGDIGGEEKVQLHRFYSKGLHLEIQRKADGVLPLASVLSRFLPNVDWDEALNVELLAQGKSEALQSLFVFHLGEIDFDLKNNKMKLSESTIQRGGRTQPFAAIGELNVENVVPGEKPIIAKGKTVAVEGIETGENLYDFNTALNMVNKLIAQFSTGGAPVTVKSLAFTGVKASVLANNAQANAPTSIGVELASLNYENGLNLGGITLSEMGQPLLTAKQLAVGGFTLENPVVQSVELNTPVAYIREDASNGINLSRAMTRVNSIMASFAGEGDAGSGPAAPLPVADLSSAKVEYWKDGAKVQDLLVGAIKLNPNQNRLAVLNVAYQPPLALGTAGFTIAEIAATYDPKSNWSVFESLNATGIKLDGWIDEDGVEPFDALSVWNELAPKLSQEMGGGTKSNSQPTQINTVAMQIEQLSLEDRRMGNVKHVWGPIDLDWNNVLVGAERAPMSDFALDAQFLAPSSGSASIKGKVSPVFSPLNTDLKTDVTIDDLKAYSPYYEESMPVNLASSGLQITGTLPITKNQMEATFDIALTKPQFTTFEDTFAQKFKTQMAVTTLNDLKNADGDIVLQNNKVSGDVTDPQFQPGISVFSVLGNTLVKRIVSIPGMVTDPIGTTKDLIDTSLGTAGGAVKGLKDGIKSLFGGNKKQEE